MNQRYERYKNTDLVPVAVQLYKQPAQWRRVSHQNTKSLAIDGVSSERFDLSPLHQVHNGNEISPTACCEAEASPRMSAGLGLNLPNLAWRIQQG